MQTIDEFYLLQASIRNLMMLKLAYDKGFNVENYASYINDFDYGIDNSWEIFMNILHDMFSIVDVWYPYSEEDMEDKYYWSQLAGFPYSKDELESIGVIVILDDQIKKSMVPTGSVRGLDFYGGFGEIRSLDNGMVIIWCEDDGQLELVDIVYDLIHMSKGN
ncbi:hypothetical protein [Neobacillus sp.]|uniref:hypothetical protein n=1 Tax=Neobacillus sp. TaxID=2675273 RepID=UPI0035B5207C